MTRTSSQGLILALAAMLLTACAARLGAEAGTDRPEPGLQGQTLPGEARVLEQPYQVGVRVIGHNRISGRDSNVQLSWIDHCAYVSSTGGPFPIIGALVGDPALLGVAVIDVSNPHSPRTARMLRDRGSTGATETMHAVQAPGRAVLVTGKYGAQGTAADPAWISIYDVSDCENPRLMSELAWPEGESAHALTLSPDGRRVYGTSISPFDGRGGILVLDISDMSNPRFVGKFGATGADGRAWEFAPHEISISPDERRIYAGVIGSTGGDLNRDIGGPPRPSAERFGPNAGGIYILDNSDLVDGRSNPRLRLLGAVEDAGWHSAMRANINGAPYLVGGAELGPCPGAWPKIVSIADETRPVIVGEFRLAMNHAENCPPRTPEETASGGIIGAPGTATLHYNDVDSAERTHLGLFNFMWAGLRIVDLRDPTHPAEVAYFRPGDVCGGHVRYVPATGHIWLMCGQSGFYVLELTPQARAAAGLPHPARRG